MIVLMFLSGHENFHLFLPNFSTEHHKLGQDHHFRQPTHPKFLHRFNLDNLYYFHLSGTITIHVLLILNAIFSLLRVESPPEDQISSDVQKYLLFQYLSYQFFYLLSLKLF